MLEALISSLQEGRLALLVALLPAALAVAGETPDDSVRVERRLALMGTELTLLVGGPERSAALGASEAAVAALEATDARLSTWRNDTELARLNAAPVGEPVRLSPTLARELAAARRCRQLTRGAFDPAVGALTAVWGLRTGGRQPSEAERLRALEASGFEHLALDGQTAIRRIPGVLLDEGGFGKGAGLAAALEALRAHRGADRALLDLGGQVAVFGCGEPWNVDVAHPEERARTVASLRMDEGSLATSGNGVRGLIVDGRKVGHLLDPTTGRPAPDFGSLTVWAEDPLEADCLATGLYVMGPQAALAWASDHDGVEILILRTTPTGLAADATPGMAERLTRLDPEVSLHVLNRKETRAAGRSAAKLSSPSPPEPARP